MACPMRVVLAAFSALLAVLVFWRSYQSDTDSEVTHRNEALKVRGSFVGPITESTTTERQDTRMQALRKSKSWPRFIIDLFTGSYMLDVWRSGTAGVVPQKAT